MAVFGVDSLAQALEHANAQGAGLQAAEVVDRQAWRAASNPDLGDHPWALLIETDIETAELPDEALVATEARTGRGCGSSGSRSRRSLRSSALSRRST